MTIKNLIFILSFGLISLGGFAQISADPTSGCAPLTSVQFEHDYDNVSNIVWLFGDGSSSNSDAPSHTYTNPGDYTVTFTALVNGNPVSETLVINVYGNPTASFDTDNLGGCVGSDIQFTSTSTGGGGAAITNWQWSFGDGGVNTSNTGTPNYSYLVAGTYDVSLTVTDANGCIGSVTVPQAVGISVAPNVSFTTTPNPPTSCEAPFTVGFNNNSSGTGMSYDWDFGNGSTSNAENPPPVTYTSTGNFPIILIGTDENDCAVTQQIDVNIGQPTAGIALFEAEGDTVCPQVVFENLSSGGTIIIDYGDGTAGPSLSHTYSTGGWHTVTLTTTTGTCSDADSIDIYVELVSADFNLDPEQVFCATPVDVQTINLSENGSTFEWVIGPDTTYGFEPFFSIPVPPIGTFGIANQITIDIKLNTYSEHGCIDSTEQTIFVNLPTALHYPDTIEGCAPLEVTFTDFSVSVEPITTWIWNFGDGTIVEATNGEPVTHIYTEHGTYFTTLTIINELGCESISFEHQIDVGTDIIPEFEIVPDEVCPGEVVNFNSLIDPADAALIDFWQMSGPDVNFDSEAGFGTHPLLTPGGQEYVLTVGYNGCYNDYTANALVHGPLAVGGTVCQCDDPYTQTILLILVFEADFWDINFGDGSPPIIGTTDLSFIHTYPSTGSFPLTITSYSNTTGCPPFTLVSAVNIYDIKASLEMPPHVCADTEVEIDASLSTDVYEHCNYGYEYDWGDGSPLFHTDEPIFEHTFPENGVFDVTLFVNDPRGCRDQITESISVFEVEAEISSDVDFGCFPLDVQFADASIGDTTLVDWQWDFGDSETAVIQNPSHIYTVDTYTNMPYTVQLIVNDAIGCADTTYHDITPLVPNSEFGANPTQLCAGDSAQFFPFADSQFHDFEWVFSNGDSSSVDEPTIVFNEGGNYSATLLVTDTAGCQHSQQIENIVLVQDYPIADFTSTADDLGTLCYPLLIEFTDASIVNPFGAREWDLGLGGFTIGNPTVGTTYTQPGTYTVQLIEQTSFGCADTVIEVLEIEGPLGDFLVDQDVICKGDDILFSLIDTVDVGVWSFDFGDGTDTSGVGVVSHTYDFHPPGGQTVASLTFWTPDSTCAASVDTTIFIHEVIADFTINGEPVDGDTAICFIDPIALADNSSNADTWDWFVQGTPYSGVVNPPFTPGIGTYEVILEITNGLLGCTDSIYRNITIMPLPPAAATGSTVCLGDFAPLQATGGVDFQWIPADFLTNDSIDAPFANPPSSMEYTVLVTDTNGCTNDASAIVNIIGPAPTLDWDTTLIIGTTVSYIDVGIDGGEYSWSPPQWLSCTDCPDPEFQPLEDITYEVTITDSLACFDVSQFYEFIVLPVSSVDLPDVFSPNGDGINDVIYLNGWGIKDLLSFQIYNRWGELVFETTDIEKGWDGRYKNEVQNSDTYAYVVRLTNWVDSEPQEIRGHISLIK